LAPRAFGIRGVFGGGFREGEKGKEGDEIKKDKPNERQGEFEVHGGGGTEGDNWVI